MSISRVANTMARGRRSIIRKSRARHNSSLTGLLDWIAAGSFVAGTLLLSWFLVGGGIPLPDNSRSSPLQALPAQPTAAVSLVPAGVTSKRPSATKKAVDPLDQRLSLATIPDDESGKLTTVPGTSSASGPGRTYRVRVQIESGLQTKLGVTPKVMAEFILETLSDSRSWAHNGERRFARTESTGEINVIVATANTSRELCLAGGLNTFGRVSCSIGNKAIINADRWADGTSEFPNIRGYRQYVINHEVGHVLGYGHESCPGAGKRAPVMQQQTKQVAPCTANYWPYP